MRNVRFWYIALVSAALSANAGQQRTLSTPDYLPGIQSALPSTWTCRIADTADSQAWPTGIFKPLFIAYFNDTVHAINDCHGWPARPNLTLCFYADSRRDTIGAIVRAQSIFSRCIPIKYLESAEYFIVTSPCFINGGCFTNEAKALIAPLDSALARYFNQSQITGVRAFFPGQLAKYHEKGTVVRVLANGRAVSAPGNENRFSAPGVRFRAGKGALGLNK